MNIKNSALAAILATITLVINTAPRIYLQNDYKEQVIYKLNNTEYPIASNTRVPLGDANNISSLYIKSITFGSSYKNISPLVTAIKNQSSMYPNQNAVIVIRNTRNIFEWKFDIKWEGTAQNEIERTVTIFRLAKDANELYRFITVNNILGGDYGNKTQLICAQNYTKAENNGLFNLCKNLLTQMNFTQNALRQLQGNFDKQYLFLAEFLKTINNLHKYLQQYKQTGIL